MVEEETDTKICETINEDTARTRPLSLIEVILSMNGYQYSDIEKLKFEDKLREIPKIEAFKLAKMTVSDLAPFTGLVDLKVLSQAEFKSIEGLDEMKYLKRLLIASCPVESLDALSSLTSLKTVHIMQANVKELPNLCNNTGLLEITVSCNCLNDGRSIFNKLPQSVKNVNFAGNKLSFAFIDKSKHQFPNLVRLNLASNKINTFKEVYNIDIFATSLKHLLLEDLNFPLQPNKVTKLFNYRVVVNKIFPGLHKLDSSLLTEEYKESLKKSYKKKYIYYQMKKNELISLKHQLLSDLYNIVFNRTAIYRNKYLNCESTSVTSNLSIEEVQNNKSMKHKLEVEIFKRLTKAWTKLKRRISDSVKVSQEYIDLEVNTGGNLKLIFGTEQHGWFNSCKQLLESRLDSNLHIQSSKIYRVCNRSVKLKYEEVVFSGLSIPNNQNKLPQDSTEAQELPEYKFYLLSADKKVAGYQSGILSILEIGVENEIANSDFVKHLTYKHLFDAGLQNKENSDRNIKVQVLVLRCFAEHELKYIVEYYSELEISMDEPCFCVTDFLPTQSVVKYRKFVPEINQFCTRLKYILKTKISGLTSSQVTSKTVPSNIFSIKKLTNLMNNNTLNDQKQNITQVKLCFQGLQSFDFIVLSSLPNLKELSLANNAIRSLRNKEQFKNYQHLSSFYVFNNSITTFYWLQFISKVEFPQNLRILDTDTFPFATTTPTKATGFNRQGIIKRITDLHNFAKIKLNDTVEVNSSIINILSDELESSTTSNEETGILNLQHRFLFEKPFISLNKINLGLIVEINLSSNYLTTLALSFDSQDLGQLKNSAKKYDMSNLKEFNLNDNLIKDLTFLSQYKLTGLTILYLNDNRITTTKEISNLVNLEILEISRNKLETLLQIEYLSPLINLSYFNCSNNPLTSEDNYRAFIIFKLKNIRILNDTLIVSEEYVQASEIFSGLLTRYYLECKLSLKNSTKSGSSSQEEFQQSRNATARWHNSVCNEEESKLSKSILDEHKGKILTRLNMSGCNLKRIEVGCLNKSILPNIKFLNLSNNYLLELSGISYLDSLQVLMVSQNSLTSDLLKQDINNDLGVGTCTNLKVLVLSENKIDDLSCLQLKKLDKLETLDLSKNILKKIDFRALSSLNLVDLLLAFNDISYLKTSSSRDKFIENQEFQNDENDNHLTGQILLTMAALKRMNLEHNCLKSLSAFTNITMPKLRSLNLAQNNVMYLDDITCIAHFRKLEVVSFKGNQVSTSRFYFNTLFQWFPNLEHLDETKISIQKRAQMQAHAAEVKSQGISSSRNQSREGYLVPRDIRFRPMNVVGRNQSKSRIIPLKGTKPSDVEKYPINALIFYKSSFSEKSSSVRPRSSKQKTKKSKKMNRSSIDSIKGKAKIDKRKKRVSHTKLEIEGQQQHVFGKKYRN